MLSNRIARFVQPNEERGPEYYVVCTKDRWLRVSPQTARVLTRTLRKWLRPRWVRVVDLDGSEVFLRPADIDFVAESTPAQRAAHRKLTKQLESEDEGGEEPAWG
jgi:hypothetical protein